MSMILALTLATPFPNKAAMPGGSAAAVQGGCRNGSFSATEVADPAVSLRSADVSVVGGVTIVSVARATGRCDANVASVFVGGVLAKSGDSWSDRPSGFVNVGGGGTYYHGVECPGEGHRKCINVPGSSKRYVVLDRRSISLLGDGGMTRWISVGAETKIVDMAYLPAPDSPGGRVFVYFRTPRGGYFATFDVGA